jgi:phospholipid transport system substrate-binding protein
MGKTLAAWMMMTGVIASPAAGPRETVETATLGVIGMLQESGPRGRSEIDRRAEIRRIAHELLDFTEVARRALSRYWAARTPKEQAEFVGLLTDLLERSYMSRIEVYAGERIVYTGQAVDGTYATVRSKVITQRGSETGLDYRLHLRDGRWRVYDVLIDGASFVSTFRVKFDRVIQAESYGALVERLRKRALAGSR